MASRPQGQHASEQTPASLLRLSWPNRPAHHLGVTPHVIGTDPHLCPGHPRVACSAGAWQASTASRRPRIDGFGAGAGPRPLGGPGSSLGPHRRLRRSRPFDASGTTCCRLQALGLAFAILFHCGTLLFWDTSSTSSTWRTSRSSWMVGAPMFTIGVCSADVYGEVNFLS